ncbi:RING/U-box protein [Trifolium repens]|nr:RING/U-box protein [Trifolium repens]
MVKGGKVSRKGNLRKKDRSKGGGSDDSDEDYVVSDDVGNVSDCPEDDCFSLDGCAPEDSFDGFVEDEDGEEEEIQPVTKFNRSRAKTKTGVRSRKENASKTSRKRQRITYKEQPEEEEEEWDEKEEEDEVEEEEEDDDDYDDVYEEEEEEEEEDVKEDEEEEVDVKEEEEEEEEEEEVEEVKEEEKEEEVEVEEVKEEEKEEEEEEEEVEEVDGNDVDEDFSYGDDEFIPEEEDYTDEDEEQTRGRKKKKEDFSYEDEEFIPTEEDYTDEDEEETRGIKKKNNGMKMGKKKALKKRVSAASSRSRKRSGSRVSKKPKRKRRRKNGGSKRKVECDDVDDFSDDGPAIRTNSRNKSVLKRRRVILEDANSGSDCETRQSDYEFTISEEEKEQVREAMELCGNIRRNLRRASLRMKNEVVRVHEDLHQQRKPPARKGKEKIEESQGRKGKEKVEDLKSEVGKQVCGICLSEENKRRVRGVLNSCTHYFCFACIMEWSKVESRCPLCKQRFQTISKPARSTTAEEAVIQVPERDQVYQPTEEELRSYIDPYESVICSECHLGGDDGLMLLCDICDSPAHTYCVGLGHEVPEGNWYCDGCRPVALASLNSQAQESDLRATTQSLPSRPSPVHVRESIDLNLISSPHTSGFGHLSSSRFSGRSAEGASPMSGGGAPTLSERRWIHRQIQQLRSIDRMTTTNGRINGVPATTNTNGDPFSIIMSNSRRPVVQDSNIGPVNSVIWPGILGAHTLSDNGPIHPCSSRSNIDIEGSMPLAINEEGNLHIVKERLQSMVKSHLKRLSQDTDLGYNTYKDIASSSTHTILAACGLEHKTSEVCNVPPPSVCPHIELIAGGQTSMIKGCCSSCFDSFVGDVVKRILDTRMSSQWLRLGL